MDEKNKISLHDISKTNSAYMDGQILESIHETKFLGMILDDQFVFIPVALKVGL